MLQGIEEIIPPKQKRLPLPFLLSLSFFYVQTCENRLALLHIYKHIQRSAHETIAYIRDILRHKPSSVTTVCFCSHMVFMKEVFQILRAYRYTNLTLKLSNFK